MNFLFTYIARDDRNFIVKSGNIEVKGDLGKDASWVAAKKRIMAVNKHIDNVRLVSWKKLPISKPKPDYRKHFFTFLGKLWKTSCLIHKQALSLCDKFRK